MWDWLLKKKNSNLDVLSYGGISFAYGADKIDALTYIILIVVLSFIIGLLEATHENK